ncbi:hydrogenase formation protein HypD [bacterium]|nr:hydrogenase formation protein HypD [bacterium]
MKYLDEFRDAAAAKILAKEIQRTISKPWTIMEICGGQTHTILKYGIETMLPPEVTLVHGPGCPVCVTPLEMIDKALAIASRPDVIFTSFGDMLRVPGSHEDLLSIKARGADIRMVYSPLDAVQLASARPDKNIVFFAVGFETTAPANAMAVMEASRRNLKNFSILCSHVLVPPAIDALLSAPEHRIQAFLAAGHVCTVMGYEEYFPLSKKFRVPIIVTGFEPVDILQGILIAIQQLEVGRCEVENQYRRVVSPKGNIPARQLLATVFEITDRAWRGIGKIPASGYRLKDSFSAFDAEKVYNVGHIVTSEPGTCIAGEVLQGLRKPTTCQAFGKECTPEHPLGAPMVSSEGACAAYFHYGKIRPMKTQSKMN